MRILLVGEYSGFHNTLKKGLIQFGHDVTLVGDGDQYKDYPVDISTRPTFFSKYWLTRKFKNVLFKAFNIDCLKIEQGLRYLVIRSKLKHYDVVQLVNSDALNTYTWLAKPTLTYLFKNNKKIILSACGDDTPFVDWLLNTKEPYHLLTPFLEGKLNKNDVRFTLKYVSKPYKTQYKFVVEHVSHIIPTDIDYYIPLKNKPKVAELIPMPIDLKRFEMSPNVVEQPIVIFHGISLMNYHKKGNWYFEEALKIIKNTYASKVKIITTKSLPYAEYIEAYNESHILLDQVYSYDQGYNALEAMAKDKVVFTGAEDFFYEHYNLDSAVCINAKPDVKYLVNELRNLIDNPSQISDIGRRAQIFVSQTHSLHTVTKRYLSIYES